MDLSGGRTYQTEQSLCKGPGAVPSLPQGSGGSQEGKEGMGGEVFRGQRDRIWAHRVPLAVVAKEGGEGWP